MVVCNWGNLINTDKVTYAHKCVTFAAVLTEPLSCISHGWDRIAPIPVGYRILILGAGIIGNLWASVLHLQGHRRVTVSEPQEARRKLLKNLGEQEKNESFFVHHHHRFNSLDYIASNDRKNYELETMCKEEDMFYWH